MQNIRGMVLDIGCGDRWVEKHLPPAADYVGLDYPITVSKGYAGKPDVLADGQCLPFKAESFDTVLLLDVLEHIPSPDLALSEAKRVLKPQGTLLLQVPFLYPLHDEPHDYQRWTGHGLRISMDKHGFQVLEVSPYGHPVETATALIVMSIAKGMLDAAYRRHPVIALAPLVLLVLPLINLAGALLSAVLPNSGFMPMGYRVVAVKP